MNRIEIDIQGLPLWAFVIVAAALLFLVVAGYRRDRGLAPPWVGRLCTALRAAAALLLLGLFLEVAVLRHGVEEEPGELLLVLDGSRSMGLRDEHRPGRQKALEAAALGLLEPGSEDAGALGAAAARLDGLSRLDLARAILEAGSEESPLARLRARFRVAEVTLGEKASGGAWTDLGDPIADLAARRSRATLAGVILVTDGRHNRGRRPEEAMLSLARLGVPLFALGAGADEPPRDVKLRAVDAEGKVFAGDEVPLDLAIETWGTGPLAFPVRIALGERTLKEVPVEVPAGSGTVHIPIAFTAPAEGGSGPRKFTASFPGQPGEVTAENNARDFWIHVHTEKAKVLLVDGGPRWEHRYLKSVLGRDRNVELETFLVTRPPDRRLPQGFPREREALFARDVLVLGDVEAQVFSSEDLQAIRDLVAARGGSLVLLAGERAMPFDYAETPLEELLPVALLRPRPPRGEGAVLARGGFRPELTGEGERSPITRLVPGLEPNRKLWGLLPPMDWFAPVVGARPGASVLAALPAEVLDRRAREEAPAPVSGERPGEPRRPLSAEERARLGPLLATLQFGAGRVFYSGVDSTWKWRYLKGDEHLARFWGQVIRWAASERLPRGDEHVRVGTDGARYEAPAAVTVRALVTGSDGKPIEGAGVEAVVRRVGSGSARRVRLDPIPQSCGLYRGSLEIEEGPDGAGIGEHTVEIETAALPDYGARAQRARSAFVVERAPSREADDLQRDPELLVEMARRAGPGGRYLPLDRARELPDLIPSRSVRRERTETVEQWSLAWPLLLTFAALVTVEWAIRKRFDLV